MQLGSLTVSIRVAVFVSVCVSVLSVSNSIAGAISRFILQRFDRVSVFDDHIFVVTITVVVVGVLTTILLENVHLVCHVT